jgi:hypothetical protein
MYYLDITLNRTVMTKKFSLEIKNPCDANIKDMKPNASGFFCDSCAKNVIDLSTKTNSEIATYISKQKNKNNICARLKTSQLKEEFKYNEFSKADNLKYAVTIAASVLLTTPIIAQEKNVIIENTKPITSVNCPMPETDVMGKIAYQEPISKTITFVIEGKILNINSKKPLSAKQFPKLSIYITGAKNDVLVNQKNGKFFVPISVGENTKEVYISISSGDLYYSKAIQIDYKKIKNNIITQNLFINPKEFSQMHIAGGLGVNYNDNKKINNL